MWAHQGAARFLPPQQGETGIMTVLERISPIFFVLCNGAFLYYLLAVAPGAITADAQGLMRNIIICILLTGVMQLLMHSERRRVCMHCTHACTHTRRHTRTHTRTHARTHARTPHTHTHPHAHAHAVFNLGAAPTGKFATGAFAVTAGYPVGIAWWTMEQPGFWVPVCLVCMCTRI